MSLFCKCPFAPSSYITCGFRDVYPDTTCREGHVGWMQNLMFVYIWYQQQIQREWKLVHIPGCYIWFQFDFKVVYNCRGYLVCVTGHSKYRSTNFHSKGTKDVLWYIHLYWPRAWVDPRPGMTQTPLGKNDKYYKNLKNNTKNPDL